MYGRGPQKGLETVRVSVMPRCPMWRRRDGGTFLLLPICKHNIFAGKQAGHSSDPVPKGALAMQATQQNGNAKTLPYHSSSLSI